MNPHLVPILMYHEVGHSDSPWCITPEQFEAQMKFLHEQGYVSISLSQLKTNLDEKRSLPTKAAVITFDDGRKGVYTHAFPILQHYGFTATIYIVPSWIEGANIPPEEAYSEFLNWKELQELSEHGFELGSHSFSHANLTKLNEAHLVEQIDRAQEIIQQKLNVSVHHFSYPYGAYNDVVAHKVIGRHDTAVTVERGFGKLNGKFARQRVLNTASLERFQQLLTPPHLSLAMIVKNEEKNLARCLSSVQDLADEIIIVDTGSTDKTKEIAAQFTDKIFDFTWVDDFAAARNEALKHAAGDWILILDADEIIAQEDHATIQEAINNWDITGYRILTRNYTNATSMSNWRPSSPSDSYAKSYKGWFPSLKVRLFQRKENIQFEGRIHEMVDFSIAGQGKMLKVLPILVHHYGEKDQDSQKVQRYMKLSQQKVQENPQDAKAYFELGVLHKEAGQYADAEKAFMESIHQDEIQDKIRLLPRLNLAIVQQKQQKYAAAIENYQKVLEKAVNNSNNPEAHFGLGFCYFQQNELEQALHHFQQAVIQNPYFLDAYINLGAVWERLGKYKFAIDALSDALALSPENARAHYNIGVVYEKVGDLTKAMAAYENAIELNYSRKAELIPKVAKIKEILGFHL